ncbi:hypothetical protein IDJ77_26850 [Mucilaginibacter sp. ZT4R22]|uniref:AhpC/TSA family protein n=1 Tax=Mucilaginibacter pankratovii TaxID=2772110 RepID=A0ABR7X179_9SPHI|nr:hypothetical protein [Mucilaginibacter pankratovii]MBD1367459.1 hypothetical protein [Mucilaginibacter pankratovii]
MKNYISFVFYTCLVLLGTACQNTINYDYQENLESFVKKESGFDLAKEKKSVVLILQNEDCICTKEDIELSKSIYNSLEYKDYKFNVILSSRKHKFLREISPTAAKRQVNIIYDENNLLINSGYVAVTDRIIVYNDGKPTYFADMHVTKPSQIREQLL